MHQLEGFQYAAALDLNIAYYTIRVSPTSYYMTNIYIEFGKSRYNGIPTGMWDLGDILQAKSDELIGDIEGVKTYINDIFVLSK